MMQQRPVTPGVAQGSGFDIYTDNWLITSGAFGVAMMFLISPPAPAINGTAQLPTHLCTVRCSPQAVKMLIYNLAQTLRVFEQNAGDVVVLPQALNENGIGPEDWETFWRRVSDRL